MKILSLFDGISCARVALERVGIPVEAYYASEIDKYAMQISSKNYPDIVQVGSVVGLDTSQFQDIDLLIGGSPCQDLSIAKKNRQGLDGERSGLFWEYVRILKEVKPKYFILENVNSMPKEAKAIITEALGVEPIMINAALVSAQNRKRLFWFGELVGDKYEQVIIPQPEDRGTLLKDILEENVDEKYFIPTQTKTKWIEKGLSKDGKAKSMSASQWKGIGNDGTTLVRVGKIGKGGQGDRIYSPNGKSVGLSALGGGRGAKTGLYRIEKEPHGTALDYYNDTIVPNGKAKVLGTNPQSTTAVAGQLVITRPVALRNRGDGKKPEYNGTGKANSMTTVQTDSMVQENSIIRKLTPIECERLQGLEDGFTEGVSNTQRYKALGNAFNVDVVSWILSFVPKM